RSDDCRYIHAAHARLRVDQDIPRTRTDDPADSDVGLRVREPQLAGAGFPADGARARSLALPAQAVHAGSVAGRGRRVPVGSAVPRLRYRPAKVQLTAARPIAAARRRRASRRSDVAWANPAGFSRPVFVRSRALTNG